MKLGASAYHGMFADINRTLASLPEGGRVHLMFELEKGSGKVVVVARAAGTETTQVSDTQDVDAAAVLAVAAMRDKTKGKRK